MRLQTQPLEEEEEPTDFGAIPFDDDSEQAPPPDASHQLNDESMSRASGSGAAERLNGTAISGLEDDEDASAATGKRRTPAPTKPRRRKRRKVIIDNENTELSNEHIKDMLANTDDIVLRQIHPAEVEGSDDEDEDGDEMSLTQPFLAKGLNPMLLNMWRDHYYQTTGQPCYYDRLEEEEDVEVQRQQQADEEDEVDARSTLSETAAHGRDEDAELQHEEEPEDDGFPIPMDDEEEEMVEQAEEPDDDQLVDEGACPRPVAERRSPPSEVVGCKANQNVFPPDLYRRP